MRVFPFTVGFAVLAEHHSGNSVVRPKIADLGPASVQRPHCHREATKATSHRKPIAALGNCTVRAGVFSFTSAPPSSGRTRHYRSSGALGGRSHLLRYQVDTRPRQGIRCVSAPKVPLAE